MANSGSHGSTPASQKDITIQSALPNATVGKSYDTTVSVTGGRPPYVFSVAAGHLPPGLSLGKNSGEISGTPAGAGQFAFTISVEGDSSDSSGTRALTLTVNACAACVTVQISPLNPSVAPGGKLQFSATLTNTSNSAVTWSASAGSITADGLFTAPLNSSTKTVTVTATSVAQPSAQASTTVSVTANDLTITSQTIPPAYTGTPYNAALSASGGQTPYRWSLASGSLPSGLQLGSNTGAITGTTAQAGTFSLTIAVADGASHTAQQNFTLTVSNLKGSCGPPAYNCSRTDFAIVPVPSSLPSVGRLTGANTIVVDPDFGNRIVRITDYNTDPSAPSGAARTYVTSTSGSADENLWNLDSSLLLLQGNDGAAYPYTFDASALQAARMYVASYSSTGGLKLSGGGMWSRSNPNVLYQTGGNQITKYDFTNRTTAPNAQTVYDFTTSRSCLPPGFASTWTSRGGVSAGDSAFGMAFSDQGPQGTGVYALVYTVGRGCSMLNTQTGRVTSDWGSNGTVNIPDRWLIHNVKISKDGNWLIVAPQNCLISSCQTGPYFWQIGTTNVGSCGTGGNCSGHWTEGYSHWVNNNNNPLLNEVIRSFSLPNTTNLTNHFPNGLTPPLDQHQSWNNADPSDTVPFAASTWSPVSPFPAPWYNEIVGVAADGSGTVWRFAHSFITTNSQAFSTQYAIGSVSQDGRFFLFSSDWMGTLGSESGTTTCAAGVNCRGDVFVVELR